MKELVIIIAIVLLAPYAAFAVSEVKSICMGEVGPAWQMPSWYTTVFYEDHKLLDVFE